MLRVVNAAVSNPPCRAGESTLRRLSRVPAGVAVRVKQLLAAPEVCHRLREMGLNEDSIIRLVARQSAFICQVRNARLAFTESMADLILVESLDATPCA